MKGEFSAIYIWPFEIRQNRSLSSYFEWHAWKPSESLFDAATVYKLRAYFSGPVNELFFNNVKYYTRSDFTEIRFPEIPSVFADIESVQLLVFPKNICLLAVSLKYLRQDRSHEIEFDEFLRIHAVVRNLFPQYFRESDAMNGNKLVPAGVTKVVFVRREGHLIEFDPTELQSPDYENVKQAVSWSPLLNLLYPYRDRRGHDSVVDDICYYADSRLPNMLFCSIDKDALADIPFIYKAIVGDPADDVLPQEAYYTKFVSDCAIDNYFDKDNDKLNVRYFIYSHCFGIFGANNDWFVNNIIPISFKTNYFMLYVLRWYQYTYLQSDLSELHCVLNSDGRRWKDGQRWKKLSRIIDRRTSNLTTTLLSQGALQIQAAPFIKKLTESLDIERMAANLKAEFDGVYDYVDSKQTLSLTLAAVYIGILSIISILVAVFFGFLGTGDDIVLSNNKRLPKTIELVQDISINLFYVGSIIVLVISLMGQNLNNLTEIREAVRRTLLNFLVYIFSVAILFIIMSLLFWQYPFSANACKL